MLLEEGGEVVGQEESKEERVLGLGEGGGGGVVVKGKDLR